MGFLPALRGERKVIEAEIPAGQEATPSVEKAQLPEVVLEKKQLEAQQRAPGGGASRRGIELRVLVGLQKPFGESVDVVVTIGLKKTRHFAALHGDAAVITALTGVKP